MWFRLTFLSVVLCEQQILRIKSVFLISDSFQIGVNGSLFCNCKGCIQWQDYVEGRDPRSGAVKYEVFTTEYVTELAHYLRYVCRFSICCIWFNFLPISVLGISSRVSNLVTVAGRDQSIMNSPPWMFLRYVLTHVVKIVEMQGIAMCTWWFLHFAKRTYFRKPFKHLWVACNLQVGAGSGQLTCHLNQALSRIFAENQVLLFNHSLHVQAL